MLISLFLQVELKKSAMSRQTSTIPDRKSKPIKVPTFPETTFEEVYARQQAARKKREQILGKIATEEPDNEDDISVAEFQIKGKQRKRLDDRIYEWLEGVPESGFSKGQRKLNVEETKDWLEMGKKLRRVKVNDEAKSAGSWVGGKFFPDGFW